MSSRKTFDADFAVTGFRLTELGGGRALFEPLQGINPADPEESLDVILREVKRRRTTALFYDLSGVTLVDETYYAFLNRLAAACRALGVRMSTVGLRPAAAYALAAHLDAPPRFATLQNIFDAADGRKTPSQR